MAYGGLLFSDSGCPVPDVYIDHVSDMINVWDTVSTVIHLLWMFLPTDCIIYNGPLLYQIYVLNLRKSTGEFRALQSVLLMAFVTVNEPLASCMMVHFWVCFFKWQLACNFSIVEGILLFLYQFLVWVCSCITQVCLSFFRSLYFPSEITSILSTIYIYYHIP